MSRTIVIFNDGTGQHLNSKNPSNISKLFQSVIGEPADCSNADYKKVDTTSNQLSFYIRGIGTEDLRRIDGSKDRPNFWQRIWDWFGDKAKTTAELATGSSIKDRVERTLRVIEENYNVGDRLILVGFSRGAASVRIVAGELQRIKPGARVEYLLVFDTVYSVIGELEIRPGMKLKRFDETSLAPHVNSCDHLISGDEMRDMFPLTEISKRENVRQILFAGSHSDVGGGNPSNALSDISLDFALRELRGRGISISPNLPFVLRPDHKAAITWDRFNGVGQTHFPRDVKKLTFVVHRSVIDRANSSNSVSIALAQLSTFESTGVGELIDVAQIDSSFNL
ncbi:MAG: DUF2235 domain-containing protein [Proteobacteria bacterium]|nr:MAG: DUF2235 domain-containing protein [Pseudomonadota bacterium]